MLETICQEAGVLKENGSKWDGSEPESSINITSSILLTIAVIFGIVTNATCFIIIKRCKYRSGTTTLILKIIAVVDSIFLVLSFAEHVFLDIIEMAQLQNWFIRTGLDFYYSLLQVFLFEPTAKILHRYAAFLIVIMTFEQYLFVYKPVKKYNLMKQTKCLRMTIFLSFFAIFVASSYEYLAFRVVTERKCNINQSETTVAIQPSIHNGKIYDLLYHAFYLIVLLIFPFSWYQYCINDFSLYTNNSCL